MKKFLLISYLLTLCIGYTFAQCGVDEVKVKVDILTDNWGEETYWTLSNLAGNVILQGGQGGIYEDNFIYADSVCVALSDCLFFEILTFFFLFFTTS